jgi:hypothetical protein
MWYVECHVSLCVYVYNVCIKENVGLGGVWTIWRILVMFSAREFSLCRSMPSILSKTAIKLLIKFQ